MQFWTRRSPRPQKGETYGSYRIEEFIFETKFSLLYSSTNINDGSKKAAKFIKCIKGREDQVLNEANIMNKISHPNLLKLEYSLACGPYYLIVSNFAPFQNLYLFTTKNYPSGMPIHVAQKVMKQMVSAVNYLHNLGIWHRDIKPQNFLVFNTDIENPYIVLADFGTAKEFQEWQTENKIVGTRSYMAPELINRQSYTKAVDIWALGITFYFILTCEYAFDFPDQNNEDEDYEKRIRSGDLNYDLLDQLSISDEPLDIIKKTCDILPGTRIKASDLQNYPWIKESEKTPAETEIANHLGPNIDYEYEDVGYI